LNRKIREIIISVLLIVLIAISFWLGFTIEENKRLAGELESKSNHIAGLELNNGTQSISLGDKDSRVEQLEEELIISELTLEYAKNELYNLTIYTKFLQELCDKNKLQYPYYVPVSEGVE